MFDMPKNWLGVPLERVSRRDLENIRGAGYRPTVKAIVARGVRLRHGRLCASYISARVIDGGGCRRFNFPGGGAKSGQDGVEVLLKEFREELPESAIPREYIEKAPIIALGNVPTSRDYHAKRLILVAVLVKDQFFDQRQLRPDGVELSSLQILNICQTAARVAKYGDTRFEARSLYQQGLTRLSGMLAR